MNTILFDIGIFTTLTWKRAGKAPNLAEVSVLLVLMSYSKR